MKSRTEMPAVSDETLDWLDDLTEDLRIARLHESHARATLRGAVADVHAEGMSKHAIASRTGLARATVDTWLAGAR